MTYTVISQVFNPIVELVIPIGIPTKKAKEEMEAHLITVEAMIRSVQYNLELYKIFCAFY